MFLGLLQSEIAHWCKVCVPLDLAKHHEELVHIVEKRETGTGIFLILSFCVVNKHVQLYSEEIHQRFSHYHSLAQKVLMWILFV